MRQKSMALGALVLLGAGLSGCGFLESIEPYTNTVSAQVLVVGLVNPLESVDIPDSTLMAVFVSDAAQISDIENAPITQAQISISAGDFSTDIAEAEGGLYLDYATESNGFSYAGGVDYHVDIAHGDSVFTASATSVDPTGFSEDRSCVTAGQPMTLTLTGGPYERILVAVYDVEGNETFSNIPENTEEMLSFITTEASGTQFELPGTAFPEANSLYGVAVAGINQGGTYSENLNPALSLFYLGAGRVGAIGTFEEQVQCDAIFNTLE